MLLSNDLVYQIDPSIGLSSIINILNDHPEIKFLSLVALDYKGNATDEKIPIKVFLENPKLFLEKGIQTDGSSVVLHEIATLNNAMVIMKPDCDVKWFIDYNEKHIDSITNRPIGTLKIPSFLIHDGKMIGSRAILQRAIEVFKKELLKLLKKSEVSAELGISFEMIKDVVVTIGTEIEFWIKTPEEEQNEDQLRTSQDLKEQYWKKTRGKIRTTLEKTLLLMERYGLNPEMGHKEVGGVRAIINQTGELHHIMEQLEIDWKYSHAMQTCDNDVFVRDLIYDIFQNNGLEVTFKAKPIEDVAGSGKHTHIGIVIELKDGSKVNLFSPKDMNKDYLTTLGYGALMGLLKNYEVINPFIANTTDSLNRLKPGFEAPVSIVASLGKNKQIPSRNRTVLIGLVKEHNNPLLTRFELRSPYPRSNSYLYIAACLQAMINGIENVVKLKLDAHECERILSKKQGEVVPYLESERVYRIEINVFEEYTAKERELLFGKVPNTVWENIDNLNVQHVKREVLLKNDVFTDEILKSYQKGVIEHWTIDLLNRVVVHNREILKSFKKIHDKDQANELDIQTWDKIEKIKYMLMKDELAKKSLFSQLEDAIINKNYELTSKLQIEMMEKMKEVRRLYKLYKRNMLLDS